MVPRIGLGNWPGRSGGPRRWRLSPELERAQLSECNPRPACDMAASGGQRAFPSLRQLTELFCWPFHRSGTSARKLQSGGRDRASVLVRRLAKSAAPSKTIHKVPMFARGRAVSPGGQARNAVADQTPRGARSRRSGEPWPPGPRCVGRAARTRSAAAWCGAVWPFLNSMATPTMQRQRSGPFVKPAGV